jgi:hypothetical protein
MSNHGSVSVTQVTEHMTYVAAVCPTCHHETLRVCVSHDECEFDHHDAKVCAEKLAEVHAIIRRATRDIKALADLGFTL